MIVIETLIIEAITERLIQSNPIVFKMFCPHDSRVV